MAAIVEVLLIAKQGYDDDDFEIVNSLVLFIIPLTISFY